MKISWLFPVFHLFTVLSISCVAQAQDSESHTVYLSGTGSDDTVDWEFQINGGRNSGLWSTIPVPSNWEMQGFGTYHYWKDWGEEAAVDSIGQYRVRFQAEENWEHKVVRLFFGGVMTDTEVWINGVSAGPMHQGGFYEFSYDITRLLQFGKDNILEVKVHKFSANTSVNEAEREADYWLFGGIYRPVWLSVTPLAHMERMAVDARADGSYTLVAFLHGISQGDQIRCKVTDLQGNLVGESKSEPLSTGQESVELSGKAEKVQAWSAEWPHRYQMELTLLDAEDQPLHRLTEIIGFRTLELRQGDGFYVNGEKVVLKGSNRHSIWPTTGRATNASLSEADVLLMKEMNMNAVRMSHYPPDPHFLEACDRLGLYVLDELGGWQKSYDSEIGPALVREMIIRDVNHPSIIFWDNGNEGGWNTDLDDDFALWDPQQRTVLHPWHLFNGVNTSHYEDYDSGPNWMFHGEDLIMPTEFLHGLYDGGHGAGLDDWWTRIWGHPLGLGGFLWSFADEGIVRDDQGGEIDVAGNAAPDGIVGPYREKEGSFFTIKEIWAPVYFPRSEVDTLPASFDGILELENRYDFTNTNQLRFNWTLVRCCSAERQTPPVWERVDSGEAPAPDIQPGMKGRLRLLLPENWASHDVLEISATDPTGMEIYHWRWSISSTEKMAASWIPKFSKGARIEETQDHYRLAQGTLSITLDKTTGMLVRANKGDVESPLKNGPFNLTGNAQVETIEITDDQVTFRYKKDAPMQYVSWQIIDNSWIKLDYAFHHAGEQRYDYLGVSFDYDEQEVQSMQWLGKGPYRVWKNRRKGVEFGLWEKAYNDTVTGMSWQYPEFKGFHEDVVYAHLKDARMPLTMIIPSPGIHLRLFTPTEAADPRNTHVDFPPGDLSFLHAMAPIGTKFKQAWQHGPAGAPSWAHRGGQTFSGTLYFGFDG